MARIAFVLDRIFRKFGLSGKSFIPMLIGTGCGIPGIMASRTIENERDRRMTIMTTTFIPCGAKVPFIAMIAGAIFGGSRLDLRPRHTSLGCAAIIVSGIMLKKTKMFAGEPAPFVMELPAYHCADRRQCPAVDVGTRLVLHQEGRYGHPALHHPRMVHLVLRLCGRHLPDALGRSSWISPCSPQSGSAIAWIFTPLGWGELGSGCRVHHGPRRQGKHRRYHGHPLWRSRQCVYRRWRSVFTPVTGYSFLAFNLLCAPCFAAMGAIKREMNSREVDLVRDCLSVRIRLCGGSHGQPVRRPVHG